ncbi:DNA repair and recombination protein RadA [Nanoarchaeota archaeon NZ13-N]|uniref:DNA repair and recombination protein RadA n=1 Tax=Candidatus Nanoclepta minutus TaxID=1940235 RepID=A0A397WQA8_9ARCH|nr:MAG: DNA repair and recombination protein RadA [Nanoarchaeota archaeon NZ13-N]RIB35679.1 MAG: DNA repair and recombination protein RadA [Candidatus Nanoclepta minutus]
MSNEKVPTNLEDLPGVGPKTAKKLREVGIYSIQDLAMSSVHELVEKVGLGEETAKKLIEMAEEMIGKGLSTAYDFYQARKNVEKITTGSHALDDLLGGGIETQALIECFGEFGSGKTQLGHQLAVNVQLPKEMGGLATPDSPVKAVYIDTEGTFRPERIEQMAKALNLNPEETLKNIFYIKVFNTDYQVRVVRKIPHLIHEGHNIRLIVIDSITAHFRAEYVGRGVLAERQQKLNQHLRDLLKIASIYNVAVYVTNQVMAKPEGFFGLDLVQAVGGHVLAHAITYRIFLRKGKEKTRIARLIDAPHLPEREAIFRISDEGIRDV